MAAVIAVAHAGWTADGACLAADEREWVNKMYTDYASRYDAARVAQEYLDLTEATQALKDQVRACREGCEALRRELAAKLREQGEAAESLNSAVTMQSFLATLQLRLERPSCPK
jgi:hypothetical protein